MINLIDYGFSPTMIQEDTDLIPARILAVHKERYDIICQHGETLARLKTSIYFNDGIEEFPTTGDFVLIDYNTLGESLIFKTLPRKTFFSRRDPTPGRGEQAVAANFDYVFITQSLNHDFNMNRLERYITSAWQSGAVPAAILTKADLVDNFSQQIKTVEKTALGICVYAISAKTGYGLNNLSEYLEPGKTIALLGSSGVGKSSLVNALSGNMIMDVKTIREDDSKGRHTTTHRQLIMLDNGSMVIDTPGMRELGMWDVSTGLGDAFSDVEQFLGKCRFSDCKHQSEPNCGIKKAIEGGELSSERWRSYLSFKAEAKYSDSKESYLQRKESRFKNISKTNKRMKKLKKSSKNWN